MIDDGDGHHFDLDDDEDAPDDLDTLGSEDAASVDVKACPYCGKGIYEQAEVCPYCKSYISAEDAPPSRKPLWIVIGVVACLSVVLLHWVFHVF